MSIRFDNNFKGINELADFINTNHSYFAGHRIASRCANIRTFSELMKMDEFFKREHAAQSVEFDARLCDTTPSIITISRTGGKYEFVERVIHDKA